MTQRLPHAASEYERLDGDPREPFGRVRSLMDRWFAALPAQARDQVQRRFRSASLGDHLGAFWELYLYAVSTQLDFDVAVDIGNDSDRDRRPDLRLTNARTDFQIEATVALGDDSVDRKDQARVNQLYDAIERIENRDFLLNVLLRSVGSRTPGKQLAHQIDDWLNALDPDAESAAVRDGADPTARRFQMNGWAIDIAVTPIRPELRGRKDFGGIGTRTQGFAGVHGIEMRKVSEITPIAKSLRAKAGHGYALEGKPFVVAILCAGTFADERHIVQALLGPVEYRIGGSGTYRGGGLWINTHARPINTRVSGVLTVLGLRPEGCAVVEPCLWTNPWARRPLPSDALPWRCNAIQLDGQIETYDATTTAAEVLGLDSCWPAKH
jgi:hypothetical protein